MTNSDDLTCKFSWKIDDKGFTAKFKKILYISDNLIAYTSYTQGADPFYCFIADPRFFHLEGLIKDLDFFERLRTKSWEGVEFQAPVLDCIALREVVTALTPDCDQVEDMMQGLLLRAKRAYEIPGPYGAFDAGNIRKTKTKKRYKADWWNNDEKPFGDAW